MHILFVLLLWKTWTNIVVFSGNYGQMVYSFSNILRHIGPFFFKMRSINKEIKRLIFKDKLLSLTVCGKMIRLNKSEFYHCFKLL